MANSFAYLEEDNFVEPTLPTYTPTHEEVLYGFAMEEDPEAALEEYLTNYPEYAEDFVELLEAFKAPVSEDEVDLTAEDYELIEKALAKHTLISEINNTARESNIDF